MQAAVLGLNSDFTILHLHQRHFFFCYFEKPGEQGWRLKKLCRGKGGRKDDESGCESWRKKKNWRRREDREMSEKKSEE